MIIEEHLFQNFLNRQKYLALSLERIRKKEQDPETDTLKYI